MAAAIGWVAFAAPSWGAPPLATDDASTLVPGMCQGETELRRFRNRVERDLLPACNIWFDAEIGIGHQSVAADGAARADSLVYQFKKVLVSADTDSWAFGISAATVRAIRNQSGTRQNLVTALARRQFDATALHVNLGNVSNREVPPGARKNRLSWGIATETDVTSRWTIVAEVVGQRGLPETAQVGLRWWALPKYIQLTTSVGTQRGVGRDGRWLSMGLRLETGDPIF